MTKVGIACFTVNQINIFIILRLPPSVSKTDMQVVIRVSR